MPGTRKVRDCGSRARNGASGRLSCRQRANSRSRPRFHDVISAVSAMPSTKGTQPPSRNLQRVGGEEHEIDQEETAEHNDSAEAATS